MDGISKVNEQQPIWKVTSVIKESKTKSTQWAELHVSCYISDCTDSRVVANAWLYGDAEGQ